MDSIRLYKLGESKKHSNLKLMEKYKLKVVVEIHNGIAGLFDVDVISVAVLVIRLELVYVFED